MSTRELDHLIKMINQIADNIAIGEDEEIAASKVSDHLNRFWARSMSTMIVAYANGEIVAQESNRLNPVAQRATAQIQITAAQP